MKRLLVDASNALQVADIERILGTAVARMLALELAVRLLLGLGLLQRNDLRLGQHQALLGALGFQRFEPLVHGLQVVAQPHTAHASRGDREPALAQFVGNADLTEGGAARSPALRWHPRSPATRGSSIPASCGLIS